MPTADATSLSNDEDCKSILSAMLKQEVHYLSAHHLQITKKRSKNDGSSSSVVDVSCREQVCKWIFHIIDRTGMERETAIIAMNFLDRFMSTSGPAAKIARCNRRQYQLVALTCLYIAVKITESSVLDTETISDLSKGAHSAEAITACERHILASLQWRLNGPTPFQFVDYMLGLLPDDTSSVDPNICDVARSQVEIAVQDYACVPLHRSTIAIAAILNSLEDASQDSSIFPSEKRRIQFEQKVSDVVGYDIAESQMIKVCRKRLLDRSAPYATRPKSPVSSSNRV